MNFLIVAMVLMLNMTIVLANFITLTIGPGVVMYVLSIYYKKIFSGMIPKIEAHRGEFWIQGKRKRFP